MPFLQSFSHTLCKDRELAKDLAQEALCKAWQARASFQPGTNMKAWLFQIFRNLLYSHHRRAWRETRCDEETLAEIPGPDDPQEWAALASDTVRALDLLPPDQRQALMLVTVGCMTYSDAAPVCGCVEGTLKSRASRGRQKLHAILEGRVPAPTRRPPAGRGGDEIMRVLDRVMPSAAKRKPIPART
jgi:RNA polymerase sigma-70 factor (ECF subfamily)